jgi:hypothetical protein
VTKQQAHTGTYSAQLGVPAITGNAKEPNGDDCLFQDVTFQGTHTLTFYYDPFNTKGDTISHDWQEAYWRPAGTTGCNEVGTQLLKVESNTQTWAQESISVTGPGQIYFNVHEDGGTDPTALYVDDVSIH